MYHKTTGFILDCNIPFFSMKMTFLSFDLNKNHINEKVVNYLTRCGLIWSCKKKAKQINDWMPYNLCKRWCNILNCFVMLKPCVCLLKKKWSGESMSKYILSIMAKQLIYVLCLTRYFSNHMHSLIQYNFLDP